MPNDAGASLSEYKQQLRDRLVEMAEQADGQRNVAAARDYAATARDGVALIEGGKDRKLVNDRDFLALKRVVDDVYTSTSLYTARGNLAELLGEHRRGMPMHLELDEWATARTKAQGEYRKLSEKGYQPKEIAAALALYSYLRRVR